MFIAANNDLAFVNLSGLPPLAVACPAAVPFRLVGYSRQDEILFAAARPIILNVIKDIVTRPDFADRAVLLMLAPIAERPRRPEHALWRRFDFQGRTS